MRFRSLLFGLRPSVPAWAGVFLGLFATVLAGYAQLSAAPARQLLTIYRPGPYSWLLSAVSVGAWLLAHTFINRRLAEVEQLEQRHLVVTAIGTGAQPEWRTRLRKELEQNPNYRDHH